VGKAGHVLGLVELGGVLEIALILVQLGLLHGLNREGNAVNQGPRRGREGNSQNKKKNFTLALGSLMVQLSPSFLVTVQAVGSFS